MEPVHTLALFSSLGWPELLVIGGLAILLFGRRLPEVGRSLGKGIVEFKKGLRETEEEIRKDPPPDDAHAAKPVPPAPVKSADPVK